MNTNRNDVIAGVRAAINGIGCSQTEYNVLYTESVGSNADNFWLNEAKDNLSWYKEPTVALEGGFHDMETGVTWFKDGTLNVSANCLDRHLEKRGDQVAIIWEPNDPEGEVRHITYAELHQETSKLANVLLARGVKQGDRVAIYMSMIPEAAVAMLACARIGAVHSVVFGGFSANALRDRILDSDCVAVVTADGGNRGRKTFEIKSNVDKALEECPNVHTCLTVKSTNTEVSWNPMRDVWYHEAMAEVADFCPPAELGAEDPFFILYTSGSTGKPKGVQHTTGGYSLQAAMTFQDVFDYQEGEIFWCTADVGWITGHTYSLYGPLLNGATTLMFEGVPTYPDSSRFWQVIDKHNVNIFYTAPTAIRALMGEGDDFVNRTSRQSLRILGTVGEPINPEAFSWYKNVGYGVPVVDTWWQTETGGHAITTMPGTEEAIPGVAGRPYYGMELGLVDDMGVLIEGEGKGNLVITRPWPGMMRTLYGDRQRMLKTYFKEYPGFYSTGDGACRDSEGRYQITGRVDDIILVSGHNIGTAEVESALVLHPSVAEAAVVGYPHDIKGNSLRAFVTLMQGEVGSDALKKELIVHVRNEMGPVATIEIIQWAPGLPKTRSGKIMRRILRKIATGDTDELGDTSTLADPSVVEGLVAGSAQI